MDAKYLKSKSSPFFKYDTISSMCMPREPFTKYTVSFLQIAAQPLDHTLIVFARENTFRVSMPASASTFSNPGTVPAFGNQDINSAFSCRFSPTVCLWAECEYSPIPAYLPELQFCACRPCPSSILKGCLNRVGTGIVCIVNYLDIFTVLDGKDIQAHAAADKLQQP
jgi:hypothetical protein